MPGTGALTVGSVGQSAAAPCAAQTGFKSKPRARSVSADLRRRDLGSMRSLKRPAESVGERGRVVQALPIRLAGETQRHGLRVNARPLQLLEHQIADRAGGKT